MEQTIAGVDAAICWPLTATVQRFTIHAELPLDRLPSATVCDTFCREMNSKRMECSVQQSEICTVQVKGQ
jgi:hypothetical protein